MKQLDKNWDAYQGDFSNWDDVMGAFCVPKEKRFVPDEVFVASYEIDGYEGSAFVAYQHDGKYYFNSGSHCSCYGLEDQWEPEVVETKELLDKHIAAYK